MAETIPAVGVPRTLALRAITVREGFNPRLHFDAAELERLAKSIRARGLLQPLAVQLAAEREGEYARRRRTPLPGRVQSRADRGSGADPAARGGDGRSDRCAGGELPQRQEHAG